jgi:hypothetical protein
VQGSENLGERRRGMPEESGTGIESGAAAQLGPRAGQGDEVRDR